MRRILKRFWTPYPSGRIGTILFKTLVIMHIHPIYHYSKRWSLCIFIQFICRRIGTILCSIPQSVLFAGEAKAFICEIFIHSRMLCWQFCDFSEIRGSLTLNSTLNNSSSPKTTILALASGKTDYHTQYSTLNIPHSALL